MSERAWRVRLWPMAAVASLRKILKAFLPNGPWFHGSNPRAAEFRSGPAGEKWRRSGRI